jgi:restriction endonuclease S subunit
MDAVIENILVTVLEKHEKSRDHIETMSKWLELKQRLLEGKAIDYKNQLCIQEAKKHWQDLLKD